MAKEATATSATASKAVWEIHQILDHDKKRLVCKIDNTKDDITETAPAYVQAGRYVAKLMDVDGKCLDTQFLNVKGDPVQTPIDDLDIDDFVDDEKYDPVDEIEKIAARKARIEMLNGLGKNGNDDRIAKLESLVEKQLQFQMQIMMQPKESALEKTLAALAPIMVKMMEPKESTFEKMIPLLVPLLPKIMEQKETTADKMLPVLMAKLDEKKNPIAEAMPFVEMFSSLYQKNYEKELKLQEKLLDHKYGDPIERKKHAFLEGLDAFASRVGELAMAWRSSQTKQEDSTNLHQQSPPPASTTTHEPHRQQDGGMFKDVVDLLQSGVTVEQAAEVLLNKYGKEKVAQILSDQAVQNIVQKRGGVLKSLFDTMAAYLNSGNSSKGQANEQQNTEHSGTETEVLSI